MTLRTYQDAIDVLRDDQRYEHWWTKMTEAHPEHGYWQKGRRELADYLETIAREPYGSADPVDETARILNLADRAADRQQITDLTAELADVQSNARQYAQDTEEHIAGLDARLTRMSRRLKAARRALDQAEQEAKTYRAEIQRLGELAAFPPIQMPASGLDIGQQIRLSVVQCLLASNAGGAVEAALELGDTSGAAAAPIAAWIETGRIPEPAPPQGACEVAGKAPDPVPPTVERDHPISCDS